MNRKLALAVLIGAVFGIGSFMSDTAAYDPAITPYSIIWAVVTIVNHITVWLLAAVLIGRYIAVVVRQAVVFGAVFGLTAMALYYVLSALTGNFILELEVLVLVIVAGIGGAGAALWGHYGKRHPELMLVSIVPLAVVLWLRLSGEGATASINTLDIIQCSLLSLACLTVGLLASRELWRK